jgi:hypothetical protein
LQPFFGILERYLKNNILTGKNKNFERSTKNLHNHRFYAKNEDIRIQMNKLTLLENPNRHNLGT